MKVSVCLITYNHERFIAQAIESVLMQETSFDYELVIGDDCSQDRTGEIITFFQQQFPAKIRLLSADSNAGDGGKRNFVKTYSQCQGEYVATLDGDDYWLSPHKLQEQANFLDKHFECAGCFHGLKVVREEDGTHRIAYPPGKKAVYTLNDYASGFVVHPCSIMLRKNLVAFPDWYYSSPVGDWPFQVLMAMSGDIGYLDEVMAVYRIHSSGVCHRKGYRGNYEKTVEAGIEAHRLLISHVDVSHKQLFVRHLYGRYYSLAHFLCDQGDWVRAREYATKCWREWGYDPRVSVSEPLRIYVHIYARPFYALLRGGKRKLLSVAKTVSDRVSRICRRAVLPRSATGPSLERPP